MIEIPQDRETALDIVWGAIRNENEHWLLIFPNAQGCTVGKVVEITGWSYTTCAKLMKTLEASGQLTRKWNHQHQSYWSGHWYTNNEHARGGNPVDPEVSEIPF